MSWQAGMGEEGAGGTSKDCPGGSKVHANAVHCTDGENGAQTGLEIVDGQLGWGHWS